MFTVCWLETTCSTNSCPVCDCVKNSKHSYSPQTVCITPQWEWWRPPQQQHRQTMMMISSTVIQYKHEAHAEQSARISVDFLLFDAPCHSMNGLFAVAWYNTAFQPIVRHSVIRIKWKFAVYFEAPREHTQKKIVQQHTNRTGTRTKWSEGEIMCIHHSVNDAVVQLL